MARRLLLLGLLAVSCLGTLRVCSGFNIDERFPVIKEGKTKGSFFGLSVALHKQTKGPKYLLLVGAPKEKALSLKDVNETGAVYSCPVSTETTDCTRMDLVTSTEPSEMVEGMWLGVTVASQRDAPEGRVMACGHRYVKLIEGGTDKQRRMVGKCFIRSNDLTSDPSDIWQDDEPRVCNPNSDFEMEGMCNMGISGGMTDTDIYMGTPGSYYWQGNVLVTWRDPDPERQWNMNSWEFGQLKKKDNYMGYAVVEEKKLLIRDEYTVVTGSPRDESKGSVTLGRQEGTSLIPALVLPGEQVGSYFGSSLAVADLNSDDWNDLIVGAPFYFDRMNDGTYEGGAVYVFMNENGSFQKTATMVLKGPVASGFGLALAAIGDVNQDGFQDLAVGAPFHDTGKVYIWTGSREGISEEPSQVIEGKSVGNGGFQTFGYSINGGMDMDGNRYPDILVGSLDDRIALLRSRPVVHLFKNFTVQPLIVDVNQCTLGKPACITATVCFNYTLSNGSKDFKKDITVKYTVETDMDRRKSARILFVENKEDTFTGTLNLPSHKPKCAVLQLTVAPNVRDKLEAVVFSLNVSLQEQTPKLRPGKLQNLDNFPSLSQKQKLTARTEINFLKECGLDNKCTSNLQLTAKYASAEGDVYPGQDGLQVLHYNSNVKKIMLKVNVTNYPAPGKLAEDAHQAMLDITIPDTLRYSGVRSEDPNDVIECHFEDKLTCELGNPLKGKEKVALQLIFETTEINLDTQEIISQLLLSTLSEQRDLVAVPVALLIENTILTTFSIPSGSVVQSSFSGEVMGESAMVSSSDVGSLVEYTFSVAVHGSPLGSMGALAVEFEWPFEVTNGKWLLYLTEIVLKGTSQTHCVPGDDIVNPLNLTLSEGKRKRPKRQIALDDVDNNVQPHILEPQAAITLQTHRKEHYLLDCSLGSARCVTFTCPLLNMSNSAKVIVRSRIWNSTMLEDYPNAGRVQVKGQATLKLITDKPTIKMDSVTREFTLDIDPVLGEEAPYEAPLWIIIVAAVAGILLLGVISLVLWKLGFFKRTIYYRIMPKHKGVRIRKAERYQFNLGFQPEEPQKKYWITNWTEMQHYYY